MATVGQHQQSTFTSPSNGDALDATVVRANDNAVVNKHNSHDGDATIHIQASTLALRPAAGVADRLWFTTDEERLYRDTGAAWERMTVRAEEVAAGAFAAGNFTVTGTLTVTGAMTAASYGAVNATTVTASGTVTPQALVDISGASAGQIKFPALQNASANANTLDDYNEGTFTPLPNGITFTSAKGTYTKIGRVVHFAIEIEMPSTGSSNSATIDGLPFAMGASQDTLTFAGFGTNGPLCFYITSLFPGSSRIYIGNVGAPLVALQYQNLSGDSLFVSGSYMTD
jgi:hypothetical protein